MLIISLLLSGMGLLFLYTLSPSLAYHQSISVGVGFICYLFFRKTKENFLKKLWWLWYTASLFLLSISLFAPSVRGSNRWVYIFGFSIQLSELLKPFIIVSFAGFLSLRKNYTLKDFCLYFLLFLIPFFLILKQPDLGNGIVYAFIFLALLFVSPFSIGYYFIPIAGLVLTMPFLWKFLKQYQRLRIITFLNSSYDLQGAGYNAYQALIAVGSGTLFGKGLGNGTQSSLYFLPEYHTDFIFASIVEQVGFLGGIILLILYLLLLIRIVLSVTHKETFSLMVAWGFFAQLLIQIVVNIGMNTGIVPITGITLPLLSFGGSSIIGIFISIGILDAITKKKKPIIAIR